MIPRWGEGDIGGSPSTPPRRAFSLEVLESRGVGSCVRSNYTIPCLDSAAELDLGKGVVGKPFHFMVGTGRFGLFWRNVSAVSVETSHASLIVHLPPHISEYFGIYFFSVDIKCKVSGRASIMHAAVK